MFLNFRHPATQIATALKAISIEQNININLPLTSKEHLLIYNYIYDYCFKKIKNNKITWSASQDIYGYYKFILEDYIYNKDSLEKIFYEIFNTSLYHGNYIDYIALDMLEIGMINRGYHHLLDINKNKHIDIISKIFYN